MSLTHPYCTVAEVQEELRNSDAGLVTQLERSINAASRWIDGHTGRDFFIHDHYVDPLRVTPHDHAVYRDELFLPLRPVISIGKVQIGSDVLVDGTDWMRVGGRLIAINGAWNLGRTPDRWIEIYGLFGYSLDGTVPLRTEEGGVLLTEDGHILTTENDAAPVVPDDVRHACILLSAAFSGHLQKEVLGMDGAKEHVIDKAISKTVMEILKPHRRRILI